jgi:transcriptional regulator with PAS, ATPase and Fis domain
MWHSTPHQGLSDEQLRKIFACLGFVTASDFMTPILRQAFKAASVSDVTILLEGETGTGKQILANAIHQLDKKRATHPFVTVHCSGISEALSESEFFGHRRGAFTGAITDRSGLFQAANRGTVLLDDVSDLPLSLQPKLLDVIQRGVLRSVGADREIPVNVRIVATANQPLEPLVQQKRFRSDLYYRLNVIRLRLPPLRERTDDLGSLLLSFAERHSSIYQPILSIDVELISFLQTQFFSGNVRELENLVLRMLFSKNQGTSLGLADWAAQSSGDSSGDDRDPLGVAAQMLWDVISHDGLPYSQVMRQTEKNVIQTALKADGLTRKEIAKRLKTSERTLYHRIRAFQLGARTGT